MKLDITLKIVPLVKHHWLYWTVVNMVLPVFGGMIGYYVLAWLRS